jgi:hypothetical protein
MEQKLLELILAFERETADMLREFLQRAGFQSLYEAREARMPRQGYLSGRPRIVYRFHGIGVRLRIGPRLIDFNFGGGGRTGGFDSWKLWQFALGRPARFPELQDEKMLEAALAGAREAGEVGKPFLDRADWLEYRLAGPAP